MASWAEMVAAEPDFAHRVRERFDAHVHKTLATLRRDGSPRISGIEALFIEGDLWFGSMPNSLKALDLLRDPRFALHSGSDDPPAWTGDAKVAGRAEEVTDPEAFALMADARGGEVPQEPYHLFRLDLDEVSLVALSETRDFLVIEAWRPERGLRRMERR